VLDKVLGKLARQHDPNVLVGFDRADDAGVYQISPQMALVQTVDFFTPIVDDPFTFGQIAAVNSLSDIYAMGGRPLTALALVCFPERADVAVLGEILEGGLSKMIEAGCTVIGGHSIRDEETKFGYSVTGTIDPRRVLRNGGVRPGDRLLLTKALGTGVISTAIKKGVARQAWIETAVRSMTTLNKGAAEVITGRREEQVSSAPSQRNSVGQLAPAVEGSRDGESGDTAVHAMTDITGFGLIGHAREMALASENVGLRIYASRIPLLDGALECVQAGHIPGGLKANREFAECVVHYEEGVAEDIKTVLFDPQTAGGLLIAVVPEMAGELLEALADAGVPAAQIGEVQAGSKPLIEVLR
jgi:selenide, water dikinase